MESLLPLLLFVVFFALRALANKQRRPDAPPPGETPADERLAQGDTEMDDALRQIREALGMPVEAPRPAPAPVPVPRATLPPARMEAPPSTPPARLEKQRLAPRPAPPARVDTRRRGQRSTLDEDAFERRRGRRITPHHVGIVARDHVIGTVRERRHGWQLRPRLLHSGNDFPPAP